MVTVTTTVLEFRQPHPEKLPLFGQDAGRDSDFCRKERQYLNQQFIRQVTDVANSNLSPTKLGL